jgi:hypothetical protein
MKVEYPEGNEALTEFILFFDRVYAYRNARWPPGLDLSRDPRYLGASVPWFGPDRDAAGHSRTYRGGDCDGASHH